MRKIYLIGSLRNPNIREIAHFLRVDGHEVFDDWHGAGEHADDIWRDYEKNRGRSYREALASPLATSVYNLDKTWLDWADCAVMVMPAGKSGHLELGYAVGRGYLTGVLFDGEPERWDIMYQFVSQLWYNENEMLEGLR